MSAKLSRRTFVAGTALAAFPFKPAIAQAAPLKIGLLTVKTGPLAQGGIQMEQGISLFLKEKSYTLAGRKVTLISADSGGNPAGAKTKAQELVERDQVDVIVGPLAAFELLAITDYIQQAKIPIIVDAAAEDMTQRRPNPYLLRTTTSSAQVPHAVAHYVATEMKFKRMATIVEDTAFGHEQMGGFQRVFEDAGGKIVKKLWPPLVTPDYTPFIAQIQNVDGVFNGFAGSNPVKFMRAYADLGLKANTPLIGGWTAMDDALLKSLGEEAVGVVSGSSYSAGLDTPANKQFVASMVKEYDVVPGGYASGMYFAGMCIDAALQKTGGKADDKDAFVKELRAVSLKDTPRGDFHFDKFGNVVCDVHIRRCERKDGKLVNTVIKTYPQVSQFWTYDEKDYLSKPVYSRDYPPAKYLE